MPNAESILEAYGNLVYRLAYARTQNRTDADDIFQEVFFRYIRKQPAFASDEHAKAWFIRVTLNCAKTHWRRFHRTEPLDEQTALSVAAEPPEDTGLSAALEQLPAPSRTLIHLYYFEGYSTEELAELLHRKPSTIRTQLTRARQKLRTLLKGEEDHGEPESAKQHPISYPEPSPGQQPEQQPKQQPEQYPGQRLERPSTPAGRPLTGGSLPSPERTNHP